MAAHKLSETGAAEIRKGTYVTIILVLPDY